MESVGFKVKTKWCMNIGQEVECREALKLFDQKANGSVKPFECLHASECSGTFCRWTNGMGQDPLINYEEALEM